jgi:hypothetical protein
MIMVIEEEMQKIYSAISTFVETYMYCLITPSSPVFLVSVFAMGTV